MPTSRLTCLTPASELHELLHARRRRVTVGFGFHGWEYYRDMTIVAVRPGAGGAAHVDCMFTNAGMVTLVLPAPESGRDAVDIVNPGCVATTVVASDPPPPPPVSALEAHLRWLEQRLHRDWPQDSCDGPFAQHPQLGELSRGVREQLAGDVSAGRVVTAIQALRSASPGMPLTDAAAVIMAVRTYGDF